MTAAAMDSEARVGVQTIRWETYEALLEDRGNHGPRIFYDRGRLEFLSPSWDHESIKTLLGRFVEIYTLELKVDLRALGSATFKSPMREFGLEPDECYYVANEPLVRGKRSFEPEKDPPPDLAIEVDLSSAMVNKLALYSRLGVPEVWSHDGEHIVFRWLGDDGNYAVRETSRAFVDLRSADLDPVIDQRLAQSDTALALAFRDWLQAKPRGN